MNHEGIRAPMPFFAPRPNPRSCLQPARLLVRSGVALLLLAAVGSDAWSETAAAFPPPSASMFRQINVDARLTFESVSPIDYQDSDEAFGPSQGIYQDIVTADVSDPLPFPSGSGHAGAIQFSDLTATSSNGEWMFDGEGNAFGNVHVSGNSGSNGSIFSVSIANTTFDVPGTTTAYLDAELMSSLTMSSASFIASISVCQVGGTCLVDVSVMDTNPDPLLFQQVGFHGPLLLPGPGTFQLKLRAQASAGVLVRGSTSGVVGADGQASWDVVLTVPEPSSNQLGFAAVGSIVAIAAIRRRR